MSELVGMLRHLVSLDRKENGGPYQGIAARECVRHMSYAADEIERLHRVEEACKRIAYIVRKSVNSGPLSKDPTQEADAWRELRIALGEGYDERGNLVPVTRS